MTNRTITDQDKANAARLLKIWTEKKAERGLTQVKLKDLLGYRSQSMVSQLLHAQVAMNTDMVLKLAEILRIAPGVEPLTFMEILTTMTRQVYGVSVDTAEFEPFIKAGSTLILANEEEPVSGDDVLLRLDRPSGQIMTLKRYSLTDSERGLLIVTDLVTGVEEEIPLSLVVTFDPIVGVQRPETRRPVRLRPSKLA